jgi:C-terminal processing protease CtpA/Prc
VQYVRVSSFSNNGTLRKQSDSLFQLIKNSTTQPYTILDLRNNSGGSAAMAKPYIKWIKQVRKKSRVAVLINAYTLSQGEITAYKLSKIKGVVLAGQSTKGMLAYGSNYGRHIPIAGGEFVFYPTDMRTPGMLQFENIGIQPDIELSNQEDWLKQVFELLIRATPNF